MAEKQAGLEFTKAEKLIKQVAKNEKFFWMFFKKKTGSMKCIIPGCKLRWPGVFQGQKI